MHYDEPIPPKIMEAIKKDAEELWIFLRSDEGKEALRVFWKLDQWFLFGPSFPHYIVLKRNGIFTTGVQGKADKRLKVGAHFTAATAYFWLWQSEGKGKDPNTFAGGVVEAILESVARLRRACEHVGIKIS